MLNSDHLYYFLQVAKYGSITTAAEKMHLSQPTVSLAIKKLEDQLNMQLLNRSFKGVHLTEKGKKVVEYAKIAFEYLDKIEEMAQECDSTSMNELTMYTIPALYNMLSKVASAYYKKYPHGTYKLLKLENHDLEGIFVQNPEAFVVMICQTSKEFTAEMNSIVLDSSKSYISLRVDSDLLPKEQNSISCRELLNLPLILVDTGEKMSQEFTVSLFERLKSYGEPNVKFTVPDMNIASNYLINDLGVCFYCNFNLMEHDETSNATTRFVLIKNAPKFNIVLIYKKDHEPAHIKGVMDLIDSIR